MSDSLGCHYLRELIRVDVLIELQAHELPSQICDFSGPPAIHFGVLRDVGCGEYLNMVIDLKVICRIFSICVSEASDLRSLYNYLAFPPKFDIINIF
jgi:hypothetical protein